MIKLKNIILKFKANPSGLKRSDIGIIEPLTANCIFGDETFFSVFAEQGIIYEIFLDQIRKQQGSNDDEGSLMIPANEFEVYMRRLRFVITRPTPVYDKGFKHVICSMSILKQVVLFND